MGVGKNELLKMLKQSLTTEEKVMPLYSRHLKTALFWSGLPPSAREQMRIMLGILEKESNRHALRLSAMMEKVRGDERDVF